MTERRFEIKHKGPEVINAPLPKEHQSKLHYFTLEVDGKPSVIGWLKEGGENFGYYWPSTAVSPRDFFLSTQKLVESLKQTVVDPPEESNYKLTYTFDAEEWPDLEIEDLSDVAALQDERLLLARLDTKYGSFSQERHDKDSNEFIGALLTHIYQPDKLAQFVVDNCSDNPPIELVKELIEKVQNTRLSQEAA